MSLLKIFLPYLLLITVIATTTNDVARDLGQLDTDVKACTQLFNSYTGTGPQTVAIRNKLNAIKADLSQVTSDINAVTGVTTTNATPIFNYFCSTPLPADTQSFLNSIANKKSTLVAVGWYSFTCGYISDIRSGYDGVTQAFAAKAPSSNIAAQAQTCRTNYASKFAAVKTSLGC